MDAAEYNKRMNQLGVLSWENITALVKKAQSSMGVMPDGYAGPVTLGALNPAPQVLLTGIADNILRIEGSNYIQASPSWYGGPLKTTNSRPLGIVWHTTDTGPGTGVTMARRRQNTFGLDKDDRLASWHVTIDTDGSVVQMIPFSHCAWHGGSPSARQIPDVGWANYTTVGIELVSLDDKNFPAAQVESAKRVCRALVREYRIPRAHALISHASFEDPNRRVDPGPEWMTVHGPKVLEYAFAQQ